MVQSGFRKVIVGAALAIPMAIAVTEDALLIAVHVESTPI